MFHEMATPKNTQPGTSSGLSRPVFPTRRAILGGTIVAGGVWALSYRPSPDPPWTPLTRNAFWSPRDGAALLFHNDRAWIFGGSGSQEILDVGDGWSTADGIKWQQEIAQAPWTLSANSMTVAFAGRMWRMGGFVRRENKFVPISEIWSSSDGRNWTLTVAESCVGSPGRRSACSTRRKAMVAGWDTAP